jgi:superfamily I DNA and RNA helicase
MSLEVQQARPVAADDAAKDVIQLLRDEERALGLEGALLYYGYPRYRDDEDQLVASQILLASPEHGVLVIGTLNTSGRSTEELQTVASETEAYLAMVNAKFLANRALRANPRTLALPLEALIYAPLLDEAIPVLGDLRCIRTHAELRTQLGSRSELDPEMFAQLIATLDGSRSIPRPKKRSLGGLPPHSKGHLVGQLEAELARFDAKQREGSIATISGPQRIRGLAGSGKTIVLTRKAALLHLDDPDASIAYTFHTKSLYQQVRRLITRFYRAEHDRDPAWDRVHVLHAWGGRDDPGIYTRACDAHGVPALTFADAKWRDPGSPFGYACRMLLESVKVRPIFECIFIDEGQDFPPEFIRLCSQLAKDMKFVVAYDELQSIFQTKAPDAASVFGVDPDGQPLGRFERDIVLYKCYRNPLEILVCAHAVGFGLYSKPVQMLENEEHWRDVGYEVEVGPLEPGVEVQILRPTRNSISLMSDAQTIDQLIEAAAFDNMEEEIASVVDAIMGQIADGLRPDDIVVAVVDDRNARAYLREVSDGLARRQVACNNIHEAFGVPDFQVEDRVTLTTVHKAKGNEGFAVHVIGVDAVFANPSKTNRNRLFTAMTRAKAWLRVTGVGEPASRLASEIEQAKGNSPRLKFLYPSRADLDTMKRDLSEADALTQEQERLLEDIPEEALQAYLRKRHAPKKKRS